MKKHIIFSTAMVMTLLLTSCGDSVKKADTPLEASQTENSEKEDIIITLAMTGDSSGIEKTIKQFNDEDNGCHVEIKRYAEQFDEDGTPMAYSVEESQYQDIEILQDIIGSSNIDIVCNVSFFDESYYKILQGKGAFADLYSFMENDSEVNTDTLDTHILDVNETDGKLYTLPVFYAINSLVGETQYVGTKENWTFDEFISHWNDMPEGSTFVGANQKETVLNVVLSNNLNSFIDYENAQVHFDSPDFKRMLEFCDQFESTNGEKGGFDYNAVSFVGQAYVSAIMAAPSFNPDNGMTYVGYPSEDNNGAYFTSADLCYSINAKSSPEKQAAAWQFIRTFVTEEYQIENVIPYIEGIDNTDGYYSSEMGFCVNKNAFDKIAEKLINKEYYSPTFKDKEIEYDRRFPTEKDVAELRRYINSVNRWGTLVDSSVQKIIYDEISYYFNGEESLDECIDIIQNRASIWISEQS